MVRVTFRDTVFYIHRALEQQCPQSVLSNIRKPFPSYAPFTVLSCPCACVRLNAGCEPICGRDDVVTEKFDQVYFYALGQHSAGSVKLCIWKNVCVCMSVPPSSNPEFVLICFHASWEFSSTGFIFNLMLHVPWMELLLIVPNTNF